MARRGPRSLRDPRRPTGWFAETEPDGQGGSTDLLTVLLANRECPWRCVFCDLWRETLETSLRPGDAPAQLDVALSDGRGAGSPPVRELKLYNAGSYFDARAIPPEDDPAIADRARSFRRLIVESHPLLVGDRCWRLRDRLRSGPGSAATALEVAMGLETVNPAVWPALNKRVTLEEFGRAAESLRREEVTFRAFVLVRPPFEAEGEAVVWAVKSARHARDLGARVVSLIPVRGGNGALEALQAQGRFRPPTLETLERALEEALAIGGAVFLADTWDLERLRECGECFGRRRERLERMNQEQRGVSADPCPTCGWPGSAGGILAVGPR